jgi:hypothetical protein
LEDMTADAPPHAGCFRFNAILALDGGFLAPYRQRPVVLIRDSGSVFGGV